MQEDKISKKDYIKKKACKECTHMEGKYFCDCRTRNIRSWLGCKRDKLRELLSQYNGWLDD